MKSIVTGCAGFVGSHLCERLLKEGHKVTGIDCFTDYYSRTIKEKNLEEAGKSKNFRFFETDVNDLRKIEADFVFHIAAQAGVRPSWGQNFDIYVRNNIQATQHLLEICKDSEIKKFVFASSSSVYGEQKEYPLKETMTPR